MDKYCLHIRSLWKILIVFCIFTGIKCYSAQAMGLWVGETFRCDGTSAVIGMIANESWTCDNPSISMSGVGLYRDIVIENYFEGTATVTFSFLYKLYSTGTYTQKSTSWTFTCRDNPLSISINTVTLNPEQTVQIYASLAYTNSYSSLAKIQFYSSNSQIATVSRDGLVTAVSTGTVNINVYSNVSANSAYCVVKVEEGSSKEITSVTISPKTIKIGEGNQATLNASVSPANAVNKSVTWSSMDESIVVVSQNGKATGKKKGKTQIKATSDLTPRVYGTCEVEVFQYPHDISLAGELLFMGFSKKLVPILTPEDSEAYYTWSSSHPDIAAVSSSGVITPLAKGETTVTVTTSNGLDASATYIVKEAPDELTKRDYLKRIKAIKNLVKESLTK